MNQRSRGSMIQALPKSFHEKLVNHYLWSLSKEGVRNIEREEPLFSQGMGQYHKIDLCAAKSNVHLIQPLVKLFLAQR